MGLVSQVESPVPAPMCKVVPGPEEEAAGPPRAELTPSTEFGGEDKAPDVDFRSSPFLAHVTPTRVAEGGDSFHRIQATPPPRTPRWRTCPHPRGPQHVLPRCSFQLPLTSNCQEKCLNFGKGQPGGPGTLSSGCGPCPEGPLGTTDFGGCLHSSRVQGPFSTSASTQTQGFAPGGRECADDKSKELMIKILEVFFTVIFHSAFL